MEIKKGFAKLKLTIVNILRILIAISISLGILLFFRYIGFKGGAGFIVGVLITGYILMSENPFIMAYREMFIK